MGAMTCKGGWLNRRTNRSARAFRPDLDSLPERCLLSHDLTVTPIPVAPIPSPVSFSTPTTGGAVLGSFKIWNEAGYTAKVDWGDNSTSQLTVGNGITETSDGRVYEDNSANLGDGTVKVDDAVYTISAAHTYTQPGSYTIQITVTDPATGKSTPLPSQTLQIFPIKPPTLTLAFDPAAPEQMGVPFNLTATVTNNDTSTATYPLNYTYTLEPRSVLPGNAVGKGSISPPLTIQPNHTTLTDVASFNYNWQWIPPQDPDVGAASSFLKNFLDYNGPGNPTGTNLPSLTTIDLLKNGPVMEKLLKETPTVIGYLDTLINALVSAASTLGSAVTSQTLDVTATIPYDSAGETVTDTTRATIQVPAAKKAHLAAFTTLDNESGVALSGGVGLMLVPGGQVAALGFLAAGIGMLLEAQVQYQQALDPPDPNYQTLPTVAALDSPAIDALVAQQPQEAGYFKALLTMLADDDAEAQAYNKAQGAQQAGDSGWQAKQLAAAAGFAADAEAQTALLAGLQPALPALPSNIDNSLAQAGWSAPDIAAFHQFITQQTTPNSSEVSPIQANWQAALQASQTIANQDLSDAVSAQTSGLKQSVSPISSGDAQTLASDLAAIKAALAKGDPSGQEIPAIQAFQSKAIAVALATNNLAAIQPDLDAAAQALAQDQQQAIAAHPVAAATPSPTASGTKSTPTPTPTPTSSAPSPGSTAGPIVSSVAVQSARHHTDAIVITFNEPIASKSALNAANYGVHLLSRAPRTKSIVEQTSAGRAVAIRSVAYDPSRHSVTLTLKKPLHSHQVFQLSVNGGTGGVTDQAGHALNSPRSGAPGSNFVSNGKSGR
jgi:hypothetical protein